MLLKKRQTFFFQMRAKEALSAPHRAITAAGPFEYNQSDKRSEFKMEFNGDYKGTVYLLADLEQGLSQVEIQLVKTVDASMVMPLWDGSVHISTSTGAAVYKCVPGGFVDMGSSDFGGGFMTF